MSSSTAPLTLHFFGTPRIVGIGAERASALLARPKALALLAYLAIRRCPGALCRRDGLLALFWPDSDPGHGRNSLRQALHFQTKPSASQHHGVPRQ